MLWALLAGGGCPVPGSRALLLDDGYSGWETCGPVEWLAERGVRVEIATPASLVGAGVPAESLIPLLRRLRAGAPASAPIPGPSRWEPGAPSWRTC